MLPSLMMLLMSEGLSTGCPPDSSRWRNLHLEPDTQLPLHLHDILSCHHPTKQLRSSSVHQSFSNQQSTTLHHELSLCQFHMVLAQTQPHGGNEQRKQRESSCIDLIILLLPACRYVSWQWIAVLHMFIPRTVGKIIGSGRPEVMWRHMSVCNMQYLQLGKVISHRNRDWSRKRPTNFVSKLTTLTVETLSYCAVKTMWSYLQNFVLSQYINVTGRPHTRYRDNSRILQCNYIVLLKSRSSTVKPITSHHHSTHCAHH